MFFTAVALSRGIKFLLSNWPSETSGNIVSVGKGGTMGRENKTYSYYDTLPM